MKIRLLLLFLSITTLLIAQDKVALKYAEQLNAERMKTILTKLTSKEFAGRKTGEKGNELAASYLIEQLKNTNIKAGNNGSYKQNIQAFLKNKSTKYFKLGGFNHFKNYSYDNKALQDSLVSCEDIVFAGYGVYHSTYNDFANVDITGKVVMVMDGYGPSNKFGVKCHNSRNLPDIDYIVSKNPKAILKVYRGFDSFKTYPSSSSSLLFSVDKTEKTIPVIKVNELLANKLLEPYQKSIKQIKYEIENTCKPQSFEFKNPLSLNGNYNFKVSNENNIIAVIEGTDLKNEYVVLSAHYDHLGKTYGKEIYPGADDNASGVAAVLDIARVLNKAKKSGKGPRRTVVITLFTAEEEGLYGSKYYVQNPVFPLEKTIACVNIDMVGRIGSSIDKKDVEKGYVYTLTETKKVNKELFGIPDSINNVSTKLSLLSVDKSSYYSNYYRRSDHYSFYKKDIPSIMFTNGSHADLHKKTDVVDKIDFHAMLQRTKLAFLTVWELANNPKPFKKMQEEEIELELEIAD